MQRSGVKTLIYCIIIALILYVLYHFHISSYLLSQSYYETLNSYHFLRSYRYYESFWFYLFKITYKSPNKPYKGMYSLIKFDLASPSIDHSIKFSDSLWYARGINIKVLLYICVSTFLRVIHLNIYTISTIGNVFKFIPVMMIA